MMKAYYNNSWNKKDLFYIKIPYYVNNFNVHYVQGIKK